MTKRFWSFMHAIHEIIFYSISCVDNFFRMSTHRKTLRVQGRIN